MQTVWVAFILLVAYFGLYLAVAIVGATVISFGVLRDMRGRWGQLTALQWCAVPFIMLYHALWHGLSWPAYAWADYKYQRVLRTDICRLSKELKLCSQ